jgi:hypothetical protein
MLAQEVVLVQGALQFEVVQGVLVACEAEIAIATGLESPNFTLR